MRFTKYTRHPFEDTPRKRAMVLVSQKRKREKLPLLTPIIAEEQPDVDTVMRQRHERWIAHDAQRRQHLASQWRKARKKLSGYGDNTRKSLLAYWNRCRWPGTPVYLLDLMHMFDTNRIDLDKTTWGDRA